MKKATAAATAKKISIILSYEGRLKTENHFFAFASSSCRSSSKKTVLTINDDVKNESQTQCETVREVSTCFM